MFFLPKPLIYGKIWEDLSCLYVYSWRKPQEKIPAFFHLHFLFLFFCCSCEILIFIWKEETWWKKIETCRTYTNIKKDTNKLCKRRESRAESQDKLTIYWVFCMICKIFLLHVIPNSSYYQWKFTFLYLYHV